MCVLRLEGVEVRLQETAEAFEHSRQLAKKSKSDFEKAKKLRYDRHQPPHCAVFQY